MISEAVTISLAHFQALHEREIPKLKEQTLVHSGQTRVPGQERQRAGALQDAGAFTNASRTTRSVPECASPLALSLACKTAS